MKKIVVLVFCSGLLLSILVAIFLPRPTERTPLQDGHYSVTGKAVAGMPSLFTAMACAFTDDAPIGARQECNHGSVGVAIESGNNLIYLGDPGDTNNGKYWCAATEILVKGRTGKEQYETSGCSEGIILGRTYTVEGILVEQNSTWYLHAETVIAL